MDKIKLFYDLETTGTNVKKHSIHQIAGIIEINDEVVEEFNIKTRPHPLAVFDPVALATCNKTEAEIMQYQDMKEAYKQLRKILVKYVNPFDKASKMWQVGFNNRAFDDVFLRSWFVQNGDEFYGSYFYSDSLDVLVLASQYLLDRRASMPSFKLKRVATELGLLIDEGSLHDALYDVRITRDIYRIVTGLEVEL